MKKQQCYLCTPEKELKLENGSPPTCYKHFRGLIKARIKHLKGIKEVHDSFFPN